MHIAVAIVGFRNPHEVRACLDALGRSTYADFEVCICENGGPEALAVLQGQVPSALPGGQRVQAFSTGTNLGFAGGVNACLAATPEADGWWILNPDTEPYADALAAMLDRMNDPASPADAVGCTLRLPDGTTQGFGGLWKAWSARAVSLGRGAAETQPDRATVERRQNFIIGASLLVNRRFLQTVGPMREDYFLYCEEIEWCLRGAAKGLKLGFADGATVIHLGGTSTGAATASRLAVYLGERNKMLLTRDCYPGRLPVAAINAAVIHTLRFARRRAWRQVGEGLQGLWAGLKNERGAPKWLAT